VPCGLVFSLVIQANAAEPSRPEQLVLALGGRGIESWLRGVPGKLTGQAPVGRGTTGRRTICADAPGSEGIMAAAVNDSGLAGRFDATGEEDPPSASRRIHVEPVMGTMVSIDLRECSPEAATAAVAHIVQWLHHIDAVFSTYRHDSVISRIGRRELTAVQAGGDVAWVLNRCEELRRETDGYFDAWAGGALDPSALVKGWAVQRAAESLAAHGFTHFCLAAGGDIACRGGRRPGLPWRIGIQHPYDRAALAAVVPATDLAVATSGVYERGAHILDPRTGLAPDGVASVTVCGPDLGTADAYATAAFAMGHRAPAWTADLTGYEAMTILQDDTVYTTAGFPLADVAKEAR
jgi:thiamine biosynthesis lipoprotein